MKHLSAIIAVSMVICLASMSQLNSVKGIIYYIVETNCVGAWDSQTNEEYDSNIVTERDSTYFPLQSGSYDQWIATGAFGKPVPGLTLPYSDSTILNVSIQVITTTQFHRNFTLSYSMEGVYGYTWEHARAYEVAATSPMYWIVMVEYNITSFETFNYSTIFSDSFAVRLDTGDHGADPLLIDYLGISIVWVWYPGATPPAEGGDDEGAFSWNNTLSVGGLIGVVGFIGMVGVPPAAIWLYRRDGGSKILAGVTALIGFTVSFGLFLGSISGG